MGILINNMNKKLKDGYCLSCDFYNNITHEITNKIFDNKSGAIDILNNRYKPSIIKILSCRFYDIKNKKIVDESEAVENYNIEIVLGIIVRLKSDKDFEKTGYGKIVNINNKSDTVEINFLLCYNNVFTHFENIKIVNLYLDKDEKSIKYLDI